MKHVILTLLVVIVIGAGACFVVVDSGWINVAAGEPAWMANTLDKVMMTSAARHARGVKPVVIRDPEKLADGFAEYHMTCETCHGAPGTDGADFSKHMDPTPPEPDELAKDDPAMIFWIAKNGIRMTGMPAFGALESDDKLWEIVNVIPQLAKMTPAEYQQRIAQP
ncbi:MAG TPA: c-type cytochrome [Thermoanaerobaculia bacterium]|nr:c-type cytochrome [Thermoanaerobaculia bacterium]